ncbi:hypothetical protein [Streptomyces sp. NK08204]|uniref:hypothetical protein n=1 Tax=Streptomyces sp. NK08204 TaxID=2873260 RepID=UPI001CED5628|nr:hypothetical protein [Streptomyces sp. NK08204]
MLADFQERLTERGRADRLLDLALARLKETGLVRERTTQRTDSPHVLAAVRDMTRLQLITEAVRAALEEVTGTAPHLPVTGSAACADAPPTTAGCRPRLRGRLASRPDGPLRAPRTCHPLEGVGRACHREL